MKPVQKLASLLFSFIVLTPIITTSAFGDGPGWVPWQFRDLWRFADLFSEEVDYWFSHHIQLLDAEGEWHEVPHAPLFEDIHYGTISRFETALTYFLAKTGAPKEANEAGQRVIEGIGGAYADHYRDVGLEGRPGPPHALRFIRRARRVRQSPPDGPWTLTIDGPLVWPEYQVIYTLDMRGDPADGSRAAD